MDDAIRKKLAGLLPFAPGSYVTETLDAFQDVDEEFRPRFCLRDLAARHWGAMRPATRADRSPDAAEMIAALNDGALVGWNNVIDSSLREIPYNKEAVAALPYLWIETLYWKCALLCSPSKAEKEGLGSSPPPASDTLSNPAQSAGAARA